MICVISAALFCVLDGDFTRLGHLGRRHGTLSLSETQLRERLNQLQELHILPEH